MTKLTSTILVSSVINTSGRMEPSYIIYIKEGGFRPIITIQQLNVHGSRLKQLRADWIPTVSNMFEDIIVMLGALVLKDQKVRQILMKHSKEFVAPGKSINMADITKTEREKMYAAMRKNAKLLQMALLINVSSTKYLSSTIDRQTEVLKNYRIGQWKKVKTKMKLPQKRIKTTSKT